MGQSLFVPRKDDGNVILPVQLVADIDGARSGIAEDDFHTFFL